MASGLRLLAVCGLLITVFSPVSAQVYQWTDAEGNVVFSDSPPPSGVAREKRFGEDRVFRGSSENQRGETQVRGTTAGNKPAQQRLKSYGDVDVILYSTSWCGYCTKARSYLTGLGVSLREYDIDRDPSKREEMLAKSGSRGVPVIDVEGIVIRGFSPDQIKSAVERRRVL